MNRFIKWFEDISINDIAMVGGKNASLGEMVRTLSVHGIKIPQGFAVSSEAFAFLISKNNLAPQIYPMLHDLDPNNTEELSTVGTKVRSLIKNADLPAELILEIESAYDELCRRVGRELLDVAVRSSATAEDLPGASFAGQQETFLNVRGKGDLISACRNCFASLFTDRAISYRVSHGFEHEKVRLSIGIQQMVRSDLASSGVMFTLDTESGANNVVLINSAYGLGENIVQGKVDPDEFLVLKPILNKVPDPIIRRKVGSKLWKMIYSGHGSRTIKNVEVPLKDQLRLSLSDQEILRLANFAVTIENYYSELYKHSVPMDLEWAKDGQSGELYILQARPETVHAGKNKNKLENFVLDKKSKVLLSGRAVGTRIGRGPVRVIQNVSELNQFKEGDVLVADMTDPDWEPVMKKASAIVTNRGGRTCHAAIVGREHGVPCIVGAQTATETLKNKQNITVSCADGDVGLVYEGLLPFHQESINWEELPRPQTKIMVNLGDPGLALQTSLLPVSGVGLLRMEFIISEMVKVHPLALIHLDQIKDAEVFRDISNLLGEQIDRPKEYFVKRLCEGIGLIAGAFYPRTVVVRFSDFKTNEYAGLLGGRFFEPHEENPMIGFRGASRYYHEKYREGFALECRAIKYLRENMGLTNIKVMVPFCRTPEEGEKVLKEMQLNNLERGALDLEVLVMAEIPSNILRAEEFAELFDGFSIGSNDLTQMVLGVDRDSEIISPLFNERDPSVLMMIKLLLASAKKKGIPVGICGQAPSDYPEFSAFLVKHGIASISVTPDAVARTLKVTSEADRKSVLHVRHGSTTVSGL